MTKIDTANLLEVFVRYPQGIDRSALRAELSNGPSDTFEDIIAQAIQAGLIESSPLYINRLRWAQAEGSDEAAAWVRLRNRACPALAEIHRRSGLPVTLHVLVGRAHAVIERFPADPLITIIDEVARYATPRPLTSGNTSKVFIAHLPRGIAEAAVLSEADRSIIRQVGYSYALAGVTALGCVMTAVLCDGTGVPIGALCTFGQADILSRDRAVIVGPEMANTARRIAVFSEKDWSLLRRPAVDLLPQAQPQECPNS